MSFNDFASNQYVLTFGDDPTKLGGFKVSSNTSLKHVVVNIYKHGAAAGSERFRIKIYGSPEYLGSHIAASDWMTLSSISGLSTYWIGRVRFDFSTPVPLDKELRYYFAMDTENYTENSDTFYIGALLDWPFAINTQETTGMAAAALHLVGLE